ncbi:hypothetical protein ABZ816_00830 [Actinosynnema sp. NPDC047251]|nr:hypothetical protein [Saccharothrix espanaensis]
MRRIATLSLAFLASVALTGTALPTANAATPNFRVGIQFADGGGNYGVGVERLTGPASFGGGGTPWAGDSDNYDPDGALVDLALTPSGVLAGKDFRIGAQARESYGADGPVLYTGWASEGGGVTDLVTDSDGYDPDQYRVFLEVRPWSAPYELTDFRLSIEVVDQGSSGSPAFTRWASQGGGKSAFALDPDGYDFDGVKIGLEVY